MYVSDWWNRGGGLNATLKDKTGIGNMRFQTNIGYANSKKWDVICF